MEHGLLMTDLSKVVIQLTGAEAARDFIQAMPGSTPTRKSVKMDAQEARSVAKGYLQEPGTGLDQTKGGFSGHEILGENFDELWCPVRSDWLMVSFGRR